MLVDSCLVSSIDRFSLNAQESVWLGLFSCAARYEGVNECVQSTGEVKSFITDKDSLRVQERCHCLLVMDVGESHIHNLFCEYSFHSFPRLVKRNLSTHYASVCVYLQ